MYSILSIDTGCSKLISYLCRFLFLLLLIIAIIPSSSAEPAQKTFIIGVEDNRYMPHYSYEKGEYIGFGRDILDAFFSEKNYEYQFRALPVTRLFQSFFSQEVDFKYPDNPVWSVNEKKGYEIIYSEAVATHIDGVSVLPENLGHDVEQVKILGTVRGFTAWPWAERVANGKTILSENSSTERLIQQTLIGRIQGAFANIDVIRYIQDNYMNKKDALVFDDSLPHVTGSYRLSSIAYPGIIEEFNAWMNENAELVKNLKAKYGINEYN